MANHTHSIRTLLIVDDDPDILEIVEKQVRDLGYETHTAMNGVEALDVIERITVHAVLCDISMPGMNGMDLLTKLRARGMDVPFIFLTGTSQANAVVDALRLGATDFLHKPFAEAELRQAIDRVLEMGIKKKDIDDALTRLKEEPQNPAAAVEAIERGRKQIARLQAFGHKNRRPA